MIFADLRPLRLGHDHAHEIVRLHVGWRQAHGVAGVDLGFGQRAFAEQERGQRLRRRQIVGIEPHDAIEQRLRRGRVLRGAADLIKQPQRVEMARKALQKIDQELRGFGRVAGAERCARAVDLGRRPRFRRRRVPVERTTAVAPQAAAAGARR